jgi:hypothetical protein
LTQVLDRPISGRVFFEHVIRDNLDAGRPDQISLILPGSCAVEDHNPHRAGSARG